MTTTLYYEMAVDQSKSTSTDKPVLLIVLDTYKQEL